VDLGLALRALALGRGDVEQHRDHPVGEHGEGRGAVCSAEIAVSKAGRLPGKTSIDDYSKWTLSVLNMPTGVGYVRRTRKTLSHEEEAELCSDEIFPVAFVDISGIAPPSDAELAVILKAV
jgi:hypothetical protein